jgi:hypothetical protein
MDFRCTTLKSSALQRSYPVLGGYLLRQRPVAAMHGVSAHWIVNGSAWF